MNVSPANGKPTQASDLINLARLLRAYYGERPTCGFRRHGLRSVHRAIAVPHCISPSTSIAPPLSTEIAARAGKDPGEIYEDLCCENGCSFYQRIDAPADESFRDRDHPAQIKDTSAVLR